MPHAPSAVASCGWGYDAVARLRRAVGSTLVLGRRYAPHAVGSTLVLGRDAGGSGVPGYGRVSSLRDDECGDGDDVAVMMLCRRVGDALFSVTPFV